MNQQTLLALLADVERGTLSPEQASVRLSDLPFEELGSGHTETRIDHQPPPFSP